MGVSTKSRYALRLMVRLARLAPGQAATVHDVAGPEGISADYAAQIMMALRRGGLVLSRRGVGGGVAVAKPAAEISVGDVIEAAEGPIQVVDCMDHGRLCRRAKQCVTRGVWEEATRKLRDYFGSVTLERLAAQADSVEGRRTTMFEI